LNQTKKCEPITVNTLDIPVTANAGELQTCGFVVVPFIFNELRRLCTVLKFVPRSADGRLWVPEVLLNVARVERDLAKRNGKLSSRMRRAFNRAAKALLAGKPIPKTFAEQYDYYVALSVERTAAIIAEK